MTDQIGIGHLKNIGIVISIIGGLVALIGGLTCSNADWWSIIVGIAVAVIGGLISFIGGQVVAMGKKTK